MYPTTHAPIKPEAMQDPVMSVPRKPNTHSNNIVNEDGYAVEHDNANAGKKECLQNPQRLRYTN
jgi:hypothetical protein